MVSTSLNAQPTAHIPHNSTIGDSAVKSSPKVITPHKMEHVVKDKSIDDTQKSTQEVDMPKLTEKLNDFAKEENLDISFGYNEEINRVYINVTDKNTGEVIRKLPSEEAMKFAESMKEVVGKLLDKKG